MKNDSVQGKSSEAYERAFEYERDYGNCAQATLKALLDVFRENNDTAYRGMGSFAGGGGAEGDGSCGAYVGGLFYVGMKYGRRFSDIGKDPKDPAAAKAWEENRTLAKKLHDTMCPSVCGDAARWAVEVMEEHEGEPDPKT